MRFNMVWYYEPLVRLDSLRFRTMRSSFSVVALPSLTLSASVLAGVPGVRPGAALLQLHASNGQGQETFHCTHLSCPDGAWLLRSLQQDRQPVPQGGSHSQSSSSVELDVLVEPDSSAALNFIVQLQPGCAMPATEMGAELHIYQQGRPGAVGSTALHACKPLQPLPQQRLPLRQQQVQWQRAASSSATDEHSQEGELSRPIDLLLHWETVGKQGTPRRQGYYVLYNQR